MIPKRFAAFRVSDLNFQVFDRELTKCAVLGIDMLLLLLGICQAKMEFNALWSTYTTNIYCVCTCITVYTCTCAPAPASTCTPVSTYTFCSDLVSFSHFQRFFCSLQRIWSLFRTCKIFLTHIFKCPDCSDFLVSTFCSDLATFQPLLCLYL